MPRTSQKVIWSAFAIATVLMVAATFYSYTFYLGIYTAMRTFGLSISDFNFTILNSTRVVTNTTVTLNHTSDHDFYALDISNRVFLNNMFVGTAHIREILAKPLQIPPQSSEIATITLNVDLAYLSPELVESLLNPSAQKTWLLLVEARLEGPLVGKFAKSIAQTIDTS